MRASSALKTRYFYEYVYAQMISEHNTNSPDNLIKTSEARVLHDKVISQLKEENLDFTTSPMNKFKEAVLSVCKDRMGYDFFEENGGLKPYYEVYSELTGFNTKSEEYGGKDKYIPISPYDEMFRGRESVLRNGSKTLYMSMDGVESLAMASSMNFGLNKSVYVEKKSKSTGMTRIVKSDDNFTTESDYSGVSRLIGYMSEAEYNQVAGWVNAGNHKFTENQSKEERISLFKERQKQLDKSVAILQGLKEMGLEYKISRDEQPGQIQAAIIGTKIKVRITERNGKEAYIGRVYDSGSQIYYSTTRKAGNQTLRYDNPSPEECLNLVKFALNQPIKERNSEKSVGMTGTYDIWMRGKKIAYNAAVHSQNAFTAVAGPLPDVNGGDDKYGHKVLFRMDTTMRNATSIHFTNKEDAEAHIKDAISTARKNFEKMCGVDRLIKLAEKHKDDEDYSPKFSGDVAISAIQEAYWRVLTGKDIELLKPGKEASEYEDLVGEIGELKTDSVFDKVEYDRLRQTLIYEGTPEEKVRQHLKDNLDYTIGSFESDENGQRFNPVGVATYQTSAYGTYRNTDDLVAALRLTNIEAEELKGSEFYNKAMKNRLIKFDEASAAKMKDINDPFIQRMYGEIKGALDRSGVNVSEDSILFDKNGIVRYSGGVFTKLSRDGSGMKDFTGEIGQIFVPNELGVIETKFYGTENYYCVPGYEAEVMPQKPGENKGVAERTRLRGYEQIMADTVRYQIRQDVLSVSKGGVGEPSSVNSVYRRLYDERHSLDFMEQYEQQGMDRSVAEAIIKTEARRVRYSNEIRNGATVNAQYRAENFDVDMANDNFGDVFNLVGGKNMSVLDEDGDGYFDPMATSTGINQGITRYLVENAKVGPDGFIIPSEDKSDRTPILGLDFTQNMAYNPADRQQMGFGVLMTASAVAHKVNVAQMTFGGWTQDDGIVISKEFAEKYGVRAHNGEIRDLAIGDKLSCLNGNKGVVPLIVDRNMSLEEAKEKGIEQQVAWFKANPELEAVMSPFSAVSRFNGGMTKELMANPKDLVSPTGEVLTGAMGELTIVITDKTAESKTHIYDDEAVAKGKGRKASSQFAWGLQAQDCPQAMRAFYGSNSGAISNMREMLIATGLDMSETGEISVGYQPHQGEERQVFEQPKLKYNKKGDLDIKEMRKEFAGALMESGGIMEMPFPLKYPTGEETPPMNEKKTDVIYTKEEWTRAGYTRKDGVYVPPTTVHRKAGSGERVIKKDAPTYGVPVLSSYLRSGQLSDDGTSVVHDYTNQYLTMFEQGLRYRDAIDKLKDSPADKKYIDIRDAAVNKAQAAYNVIAEDIIHRNFEGKHNNFKETIMSHRMPKSISAIVTADPRLKIDEIAVSGAIYDKFGMNEGDYMFTLRDPVLRDGGIRYLKAVRDDEITGLRIHPSNTKSFDADFDGDTFGGFATDNERVHKEAMAKLSMGANLLEYGHRNENGKFDLYMHHALDVKVASHYDESLLNRWNDITGEVNDFEAKFRNGEIGFMKVNKMREEAVENLSKFYSDAYENGCGQAHIRYDSLENHLKSLKEACIDTGAKGSISKLQDYLKYYGASCELNADGSDFNYSTLKEFDHTLATRADAKDVQYATAVKSFCTGMAGAVSQRGVKALRGECQKAVLELTYPVTQSVLQVKHNPVEAKQKQSLLMSSVRDLWNGYEIKKDIGMDGNTVWTVQRDEAGKPIMANKDQWTEIFYEMYSSKDGLNVAINKDFVEQVGAAMSDPMTGEMMGIDKTAEKVPLLDRMAYGGNFDVLVAAAKNGENLFDGKYQAQFMPSLMVRNQKQSEMVVSGELEEAAYRSFSKSDTQMNGKLRKATKDITARRLPDISSIEEHNTENSSDYGSSEKK